MRLLSFSSRLFGGDEGTWVQEYWEEGIESLLTDLNDFGFKYGFNPGQETIISDYRDDIQDWLIDIGEGYEPETFLSYLIDELGDIKFAALSDTWDNLANYDLVDLWDNSAGGDGFGSKKFLGVDY